jgi:hypothetical protein
MGFSYQLEHYEKRFKVFLFSFEDSSNTNTDKESYYANMYERLDSLNKRSWVELLWHVRAHLANFLGLKFFVNLRFCRRHDCCPQH